MAKVQNIYGKGNTSIIISEIIQNYFQNKSQNLDEINKLNYSLILSQYDNSIYQSKYSIFNVYQEEQYDIVIVLTVWKRNNLERQLLQIKDQSILKNKKTNIIVFQNSNYVNVSDIINKWNKSEMFSEKVVINFIQSTIETGYFGRFIIENMFRVVDEGSLATRNGRLLDENFQEYSPVPKKAIKKIFMYVMMKIFNMILGGILGLGLYPGLEKHGIIFLFQ